MAEKEILDFEPVRRLEQVGDERPNQLKECKHRAA
jgi:hypothetical protein